MDDYGWLYDKAERLERELASADRDLWRAFYFGAAVATIVVNLVWLVLG